MGNEMQMLVWSCVFGLLNIAIAATLSTQQRGLAWNAGARDGSAKPLTGIAARIDRASHNFLETFPFFAVAVILVLIAQRSNSLSVLGAQMYFWARVVYLPVYAAGVAYLRTAVWAVAVVGLLLVLRALF